MPYRPLRPCTFPGGCANVSDQARCPEHRRPDASTRGYGYEWHKIRVQVLEEEPACRSCGKSAQMGDHILPIRLGGTHDRDNLQPLCNPCHGKKTVADSRRFAA